MDVFIILELSRNLHLHSKLFSGDSKGRKTATSQETQAFQTF